MSRPKTKPNRAWLRDRLDRIKREAEPSTWSWKDVASKRKAKKRAKVRTVHGVNQKTGATRKGPQEDAL